MKSCFCGVKLKKCLELCMCLVCALFVLYQCKPRNLSTSNISLIKQRQAELNNSQSALRQFRKTKSKKSHSHKNDEHAHHWNLTEYMDHRRHRDRGNGFSVGSKDMDDVRRFRTLTSERGMFTYSSYYDPRDPPQIRVLVLLRQLYMNVSYSCRINTHSDSTYTSTGRFTVFTNWLTYKYDYVSGVIKCPLPLHVPSEILKDISIHPSFQDLKMVQHNLTIPLKDLKVKRYAIPILIPGAMNNNTLTRCYAPLQHKYDRVNKIVWSIELSKLLGADKFIFYNYSISPRTDAILRHYVKEGIAVVRPWNMHRPGKHVRNNTYYYAQMLAEHDCLLSEMFSAKYVFLADVDEIPFPKKHTSLVSMADRIFDYHGDKPGNDKGSIAFWSRSVITNTTFIPHFPARKLRTAAVKLDIEPLLYTYYFIPKFDSRKPLVIPERVDVLCVHNACDMQDGYREKNIHWDKEGVIMHYRDKPKFFNHNSTVWESTRVLKYSHDLIAAVSYKSQFIVTSS